MAQPHRNSSSTTPSPAFRWALISFLLALLAGLLVIGWLVARSHRTPVDLTAAPTSNMPGGQAVRKPSPLGSWESNKADSGPVKPPLAIPPKSDLGNGQPGPLLPGNAQLDSGAAPGAPARIPSPNAPWPPLGERYRAKHKKGFGGCWGELWLASDRLV